MEDSDVNFPSLAKPNADELFTHLSELVHIPSSSLDIPANKMCLDYVHNFFQGTDWVLTPISKSATSHPALYISPNAGVTHTKVLLLVHLDVVPAKEYTVTGTIRACWRTRKT